MVLPSTKRISFFVLATLLVVAALCARQTAAREGSSNREQSRNLRRRNQGFAYESGEQEVLRLREGTVILDQSGFFREDGDGATFVADSTTAGPGLEFGALPNLNLERVVRLLKSAEEASSVRWSVTGKVTEFAGRNFLLISRAVYKSASPPPVPDHIAQ